MNPARANGDPNPRRTSPARANRDPNPNQPTPARATLLTRPNAGSPARAIDYPNHQRTVARADSPPCAGHQSVAPQLQIACA
jgi:hypothetical protein